MKKDGDGGPAIFLIVLLTPTTSGRTSLHATYRPTATIAACDKVRLSRNAMAGASWAGRAVVRSAMWLYIAWKKGDKGPRSAGSVQYHSKYLRAAVRDEVARCKGCGGSMRHCMMAKL